MADLSGPVEVEVESDDDELEVVGEDLEVDGDVGLLGFGGGESDSDEDDNDDSGEEEDGDEKKNILPQLRTGSALEVGISNVASLTLGTQDASVASVTITLWIVVFLF